MANQHNPKMLGRVGGDWIKTPNPDAPAARGTRFDNACANSPIRVPARACFAAGRYVHDNRCRDNAIACSGRQPSWGTGFSEQIVPMHIMTGVGDLHGSIRPDLPVRH